MASHKVTLQASIGRGTFYWVVEVNADSDEEAVVAAENLFLTEIDRGEDWEFNDFLIEPASKV